MRDGFVFSDLVRCRFAGVNLRLWIFLFFILFGFAALFIVRGGLGESQFEGFLRSANL